MYILRNRCCKFRVETSDNKSLRMFSVFFNHPSQIEPSDWKRFGDILVDAPTMRLLELHECQWILDKKDTILAAHLKTELTGEALHEHIQKCKAFVDNVYDARKTSELADDLKRLFIA